MAYCDNHKLFLNRLFLLDNINDRNYNLVIHKKQVFTGIIKQCHTARKAFPCGVTSTSAVRDQEVGCSNHLIPTKRKGRQQPSFSFGLDRAGRTPDRSQVPNRDQGQKAPVAPSAAYGRNCGGEEM